MRILFLDLDTLRPDHLGCYGYHRDTSPNLDRIAAEGVRFENYYCSDAPCLPSRAALVSGQFGIHNYAVGHGGTTADMRLQGADRGFRDPLEQRSLWNVFRHAGYYTASISPFSERHSAWWFNAGFNEVHNPIGKGGNESAEEVTPHVLKWIDEHKNEDNWFLHVNFWDPHTNYRVPMEYGEPFKDDPLPDWITPEIVERQQQSVGPHTAREVMMYNSDPNPNTPRHPGEIRNMDDLRKMFDGYDTGIRWMDDHIGKILNKLEDYGMMDDLAIIVTADHAENMGELDIYGEHATADYINCRIPMIIRWPGGAKDHVDNGLHVNLDLAATMADVFGLDYAKGWDGKSYAPAILEGKEDARDYIVISQCAHVCQRGVRKGPWMYIRTYHDGYHLFPKEMLYNIEEDPHEQVNLAKEKPEVCHECAALLLDWHDEMMATQPDDRDPLWTTIREGGPLHAKGNLPDYIERLKKTDRAWAVDELAKRHPYELDPKVKP
jgi:choline-sulfatase